MEVLLSTSLPVPPLESNNDGFVKEGNDDVDTDLLAVESTTKVEAFPADGNPCQTKSFNGGRIKKKSKRICRDVSASASSSSSSSSSSSLQRGFHVTNKRRSSKVFMTVGRRGDRNLEALALPLGMSIAAVIAQVLDRKMAAEEWVSVDHLSMICTSAVKESLANVFGNQFEGFARNFEKSFGSTLRTLRLINEASLIKSGDPSSYSSSGSFSSVVVPPASLPKQEPLRSSSLLKSFHSGALPPTRGIDRPFGTFKDPQENMRPNSTNQDLILHEQINQHIASVSRSTLSSGFGHFVPSTIEKSVMEQIRANDLKAFEIGLTMKKLQLKESQLALDSDSNYLERFKLSLGISKASFKVEKFKTQLEDTRHAELLKKCIDCLVAGLLIMSVSLLYGTYVYSYKRIIEAASYCTPKESGSWWIPKPVSSFNSGLQILRCQVGVLSRMLFGVFMIVSIAYLLLQRSATSKQTMPVTFILLLLGLICGFLGKLCVDTLGGSGYHWLFYWEAICLLHFFANICTSPLFAILYGPISISRGIEAKSIFPYWIRRFLFYSTVLLFLPLLCGLMPFASLSEWKDHFSVMVGDYFFDSVMGFER